MRRIIPIIIAVAAASGCTQDKESSTGKAQLFVPQLRPLPTQPSSIPEEGTREISGRVIASNLDPGDFMIEAPDLPFGYRYAQAKIQAFDASGSEHTVMTDEDGLYTLGGLPDSVKTINIIPTELGLSPRYRIPLPESAEVSSKDPPEEIGVEFLPNGNNISVTASGFTEEEIEGSAYLTFYVNVVTDDNAQWPGLNAKTFEAYVDGIRLPDESIIFHDSFNQGETLDAYLSLVIDRSGSMSGNKIELVKSSARVLVESVVPPSRIGIVTYETGVIVNTVFSDDAAGLAAIIDAIATAGSTALQDGLLEGLTMMESVSTLTNPKYVILLTDGMENASTHPIEEVMAKISEVRVPIIAGGTADADKDYLLQFASASGGRLVILDDGSLDILFLGLITQLQNSYRVSVRTEDLTFGTHGLRIRVKPSEGQFGAWCGYFTKALE